MGRRGPPPTPASVVKLRGNPGRLTKAELAARAGGVAFPVVLPRPPRHLNPTERREYLRVGKLLLARGTIAAVDRGLLAMLVTVTVRWQLLEREIAALPTEAKIEPAGLLLRRTADKTARQVLALSKQFGLTPASRSRMQTGEPPPPPRVGSGWSQFDDKGA